MNWISANEWNVVCDFDGTISLTDTTDALLEAFADPRWHAVEERWVAGEIGSAECMRLQVGLLDVPFEDLNAWLDQVLIDPHFVSFAAMCERFAIPLSIASDGIDYVIRRVLRNHGLAHLPVVANRLSILGDGRYALESPMACVSGSGVCKCRVTASVRESNHKPKILFVGDGRSDFCVSGKVDLVLAKDSLLKHCRAENIAHWPLHDFDEAAMLLTSLVAMPLHPLTDSSTDTVIPKQTH